jgi:hypothetical protein
MMQFDLSGSHNDLKVTPVENSSNPWGVAVPFWVFSSLAPCDPEECDNIGYFIDGHIDVSDNILKITYTGLSTSSNFMITLHQSVPKKVGELAVTYPLAPGAYLLDILNADDPDPNHGAEIQWGFGSAADPMDSTSPLRANTGGITGGQICVGDCIPEPGTLALLGLGGLAVGKRRRLYS